MRAVKLILLFTVLGVRVSLGALQVDQAQEWLTKGNQLIAEGHFSEAVAVFSRYKQMAPEDPRPYFFSGVALTQAGHLSAAAAELDEAVRLEPNKPEYNLFHANVLTRLGHQTLASEALVVFEENEVVNQMPTAWLWLLSDTYYRLGKNDDALRVLELLSKRNPEDPRNDLNRGQVYIAKGNYDRARKFVEQSIEKKPADNALAYFELGKILHQQNKMTSAKKAFLEAVHQDGTNPEYLFQLGLECLALGELEEAIKYLERAEASAPDFPKIYYGLGRAYQKKGDRAKAETYLKKFQEISSAQRRKEDQSRRAERLIRRGEEELDQRNTAKARSLFEQALQADPDNWDAHGYLAEMFLASGAWQLARQHLVRMEEMDPESAVGNYLMATYWYQRKEFERAHDYAERVKSARPGNAKLRNLLGNIYIELGQEKNALEEYEAAVRLAPDRTDYQLNLQTLKRRIGKTNQLPKK